MKIKLQSLMLVAMLAFGNVSQAQGDVIHSDWKALEESPKLIDVSYRVATCDGNEAQIHLHVFNENVSPQEVSFKLHLTDEDGNTGDIEANGIKMDLAEMRNAECGSTDNTDLIFSIPTGINQNKFSVTITYLD
tara:strand:- start:1402 stop:1803 length:402 start_codon:yes stop_codon:yes gene_type:complete